MTPMYFVAWILVGIFCAKFFLSEDLRSRLIWGIAAVIWISIAVQASI